MKILISILLLHLSGFEQDVSFDKIVFHPVSHATFILKIDTTVIYVDPVGGAEAFQGQDRPDIILITDIHGDHMNKETIEAVKQENTKVIAPKAVVESIQMGDVLNNGDSIELAGISIDAIPMYNTTEERKKFHAKGRGNGYLIFALGKRIYISGDTEDVPEMRQLKNIDYAFICMNLPYTMTVEQAASAILEMQPKHVFPYHHRGSDLEKLKELVSINDNIKVDILDWYNQ